MMNSKLESRKRLALGLAVALLAVVPLVPAQDKPAAKAKPYPLTTCVVSGEKLGTMGTPYVFTHNGQEIKLCCKGCLKQFNQNAAEFTKKLEQANAKKAGGANQSSCCEHKH